MILLISNDLMITSAVEGAARRHGAELNPVAPASAVAAAGSVRLVLIDLTAPLEDVGQLLLDLRREAPAAPVVAFGPHVHAEKLQAARDAGCDEVLTRGQFHRDLNAVVGRYLSGA